MYLVEIDSKTGLVKLDPELSGWMAIPSFLKLYNQPDGHRKFSAVAIFTDYLSTLRHYGDNDRMQKVSDLIFEKRDNTFWYSDDVQHAIGDYKTLQYNHVLEEKKLLEESKIEILNEVQLETDSSKKQALMNQLKTVNKNIQDFEIANTGKDLFTESPVRNGYALQRLEIKLENNKSFYYVKQKREHVERERERERSSESGTRVGQPNAGNNTGPRPKPVP